MALNGYEIGIQRKIKPADHIQSMADKIQDTVVTKHPLNSDNMPTTENNLTKTLDRGFKTQYDNIQSIGDKIKETIKNNHPTIESLSKPSILIPPPLPNSPIPTFNVHSTPIGHSVNTNVDKKKYDTIPKTLNATFVSDDRLTNNNEKSQNGSGYSSSEDSYKDKIEHNYTGTLRKTGLDKSSFLNSIIGSNVTNPNHEVKSELKFDGAYSNTLNKRKLFEKSDTVSNHSTNNLNKSSDKAIHVCDINTWNKSNSVEPASKADSVKNISTQQDEELTKKKELPNHLHNNSLYYFKTSPNNDAHINTNGNAQCNEYTERAHPDEIKNLPDSDEKQYQQNTEEEIVVRRRQKKTLRDDDGRRDSHIIARPLSTITCADVADGLFPVCHKCDKAITR